MAQEMSIVGTSECLVRTATQPPSLYWRRECWQKELCQQLETVCKPHAFVFLSSCSRTGRW